MSTFNKPGPGTQSPWDASGFAFPPNSNTLDRESMPSEQAEAARQKSAQVMAALKAGNTAEANRLMGKNEVKQGQLIPPGPLNWVKEKLSGGERKKPEGKKVRDEESMVDSEQAGEGKK